jgi:PAS domain S-box-containing protein
MTNAEGAPPPGHDDCLARRVESVGATALRIIDGLTDHVCVLDADGRIAAVNRAWREFAAANPPSPANADVGASYFAACEAVTGADEATARRALHGLRAVADGTMAEFTLEYPCHSPAVKRWFELRATRVPGEPVLLVLVHRDTTRRRLAEESMRLHDAFVRNMNEGLCLVRAHDFVVLATNPSLERMFGYGPGELEGRAIDWLNDAVASAGAGEAAFDVRAVRKDGSPVLCRARTTRLELEEGPAWVAVLEDVTEARHITQALHDGEERHRSLVETLLDGVLLTTPDGGVLAANPAACAMFGRTEEDLRRQGRAGVVDSSDPRLAAALEQRARTGAYRGVLTFVRADGSRFQGEISTAVFTSRNAGPCTSMVIRDITERLRAEEALAHAHETLRGLAARLERVREDERAGLARRLHDELGQSLTDLKLDLAWVDRRLQQSALSRRTAARRRLDAAGRQVDQLAHIVRHMATELRPAILDALGLRAAIEWLVREFGTRTGVTCALRMPERLPVLDADHTTSLFRVLQEVLRNVSRHAGGAHVEVSMIVDAGLLTLAVADDGHGFDVSVPTGPGSMGLVGIRERVAAMNGRVTVASEPGGGTRVTVSIPVPGS